MAGNDNVLFVRGVDDESAEDIWDDSALIEAYDKAISLAKQEVAKKLGVEWPDDGKETKPSKKSVQQKKKKWCVGSPCRARYSEDGILYEAIITKIFEDTSTCIVKFIGYNNTERVKLSSLLESEGLQSQIAQQKEAGEVEQNTSSMDFEESQKANAFQEQSNIHANEASSFNNIFPPGFSMYSGMDDIPPAPPIPPHLMAKIPENDADALSSMLMSWYMSGFHTGLYHGMKQAQKRQEQRRM